MCFHLNKCLILLFITIGRCIGGGFQYFPYDNHNLRNNAIHPAFTIVEHYINMNSLQPIYGDSFAPNMLATYSTQTNPSNLYTSDTPMHIVKVTIL